jgi:hypothetical protein
MHEKARKDLILTAVSGLFVAKGESWDSTKLDKFRLNYEAGSIDPRGGLREV